MDTGAWQATVHGVTESQTRLSDYHSLTHSLSDKDVPDLSTATGLQKYWGRLLPGPPTPWHILEGLGPFS